jgi:hypothetical protein
MSSSLRTLALMRFTSNNTGHEKRDRACFAAFLRWRGRAMVVGMCSFLALATAKIEGQTSSASPASSDSSTSAQSAPAPAIQGNSATAAQPQQPDAQSPANGDDTVFVFKKEVQEVILHATAVDEQSRMVTNLDRSAFTVFEDGVPEVTTSFHRDDVPVAMGIVIDNSGSMRFRNGGTQNIAFWRLVTGEPTNGWRR